MAGPIDRDEKFEAVNLPKLAVQSQDAPHPPGMAPSCDCLHHRPATLPKAPSTMS